MDNSPIKIAIVGMTGAGKTVLISTLAMKMSQMADQGVFLAPVGENRRQTLRYVQDNWQQLNSGKWPPSTPAGELIRLEWELTTKNNAATVRFADCAGQDVHAIFSQEQFNYNALTPDQKYIFDYLRSANVLIFLINMEDVLGRSPKQALENSLDVDQMFYVLNQKANFPRKTALVLSQFDKYRDELKAKYDNNLLEYLRANFPQLHGRYIQNPNFAVIPVAAVETTKTIIENGTVKQVPVENFSSFNLKKLISWIADAVDELAPLMPKKTEQTFQQQTYIDDIYIDDDDILDDEFDENSHTVFEQNTAQNNGNAFNNVTINVNTSNGAYSFSTSSSTKQETSVNNAWSINKTTSVTRTNIRKGSSSSNKKTMTPYEEFGCCGCLVVIAMPILVFAICSIFSPENCDRGATVAFLITFIFYAFVMCILSIVRDLDNKKYKK